MASSHSFLFSRRSPTWPAIGPVHSPPSPIPFLNRSSSSSSFHSLSTSLRTSASSSSKKPLRRPVIVSAALRLPTITTTPLISPSDSWGTWTALFSAAAFGIWSEKKTRWGSALSGALVSTLVGLAASSAGIVASDAPAYRAVLDYLLPLAVPLLLFNADLRRVIRSTGTLLLAFLLGSGAKPVNTPIEVSHRLHDQSTEPLKQKRLYQRPVGKLLYLTITRPYISYAVNVLSQFTQAPCKHHYDAILRVIRYLKGSPGRGLIYSNHGHLNIQGYCDADWAGAHDDRRSTSGYCMFVGGNLVTWRSKKQNVVARSSAEAEYRSMAFATCELMWLRSFLTDLGSSVSTPMPLFCDNQAAIQIAAHPIFHERTRHIEVDCRFVREKVESKIIATQFVRTNDQLADVLTEAIPKTHLCGITSKLGMFDIHAPA